MPLKEIRVDSSQPLIQPPNTFSNHPILLSASGQNVSGSKGSRRTVHLGDSILITIAPTVLNGEEVDNQESAASSVWKPEVLPRPLTCSQQMVFDFLNALKVASENIPVNSLPNQPSQSQLHQLITSSSSKEDEKSIVAPPSTAIDGHVPEIKVSDFLTSSQSGMSQELFSQYDIKMQEQKYHGQNNANDKIIDMNMSKLSFEIMDNNMFRSQSIIRGSRGNRSLAKPHPNTLVLSGSNILSMLKRNESLRSYTASSSLPGPNPQGSQHFNPMLSQTLPNDSSQFGTNSMLAQLTAMIDGVHVIAFTNANVSLPFHYYELVDSFHS